MNKPRTIVRIMSYEDALKEFPEYKEEIEDDRDFISECFDDDGFAYCLHCDERIALKDMKVGILCFKKTGKSVPSGDPRYFPTGPLSYCPTEGCDSGFMDWRPEPWCSSRVVIEKARKLPSIERKNNKPTI